MKSDLKRKWVEALRSGEYEQGVGALRGRDNKFCCLGVLCAVAKIEIDDDGGATVRNGIPVGYARITDDAGLPIPTYEKLYRMNDTERSSFAEIADYIETTL